MLLFVSAGPAWGGVHELKSWDDVTYSPNPKDYLDGVGLGFDLTDTSGSRILPCIEWDAADQEDFGDGQGTIESSSLEATVYTSRGSIKSNEGLSLALSVGGLFWDVAAELETNNTLQVAEDSVIVEVRGRKVYYNTRVNRARLTQEVITRYINAGDIDGFIQRCGQEAVTEIKNGSLVALRYEYHNLSSDERSQLVSCVSASFPFGDFSGCFASFNQQRLAESRVSITQQAYGVSELAQQNFLAALLNGTCRFDANCILMAINNFFFAPNSASDAKPILWVTSPYSRIDSRAVFNNTGFNQKQKGLKFYYLDLINVNTQIERIQDLLTGASTCLEANLEPLDTAELVEKLDMFTAFQDLIIAAGARCYEGRIDVPSSDPEHYVAKCTATPAYRAARRDFLLNPVAFPTLTPPEDWTFCMWCSRNNTLALGAAASHTVDALMNLTSFGAGSSRCFEAENELEGLTSLDLSGSDITDVHPIASLRQLSELDLGDNSSLGDVQSLGGLPLESLNVQGTQVNSLVGLESLGDTIRVLRMGYPALPPVQLASMEALADYRYLEVLDFYGAAFTEPSDHLFRNKPLLRSLDLFFVWGVTGIESFVESVLLQDLNIAYTTDMPRNLDALADLASTVRNWITQDYYADLDALLDSDPVLGARFLSYYASMYDVPVSVARSHFQNLFRGGDAQPWLGLLRGSGLCYLADNFDFQNGDALQDPELDGQAEQNRFNAIMGLCGSRVLAPGAIVLWHAGEVFICP